MDLTLGDLSDLCTWEASLGPPHILIRFCLGATQLLSRFQNVTKNALKGTLEDLKLLPYQLRPVLMARISDRSVKKKKIIESSNFNLISADLADRL